MLTESHGTTMLDLPHSVTLLILQQLDVVSLCSTSRCCRVLHRLSGHPSLWPAHQPASEWALGDIRATLAALLYLPPQVFSAQLDVRRSRRFPVCVPMHNLRTILATSDAEGLADRVSKALQDRLVKLQQHLWRYDSWQELPPAAAISVCRADGASIRAALRPQAVVPRMVATLQQMGCPDAAAAFTHTAPTSTAAAAAATTTTTTSSSNSAGNVASSSSPGHAGSLAPTPGSAPAPATPLPAGLLQVLQLCQQRMGLMRSGQVLQQQRGAAGHTAAGGSTGCQWRPNMGALLALAARLPGEETAREFAARAVSQHGCEATPAAQSLAVRLFWAGVVADPGLLLSSTPSTAQWQRPLSQAARVVARLPLLKPNSAAFPTGGSEGSGCMLLPPAMEDARASSMQAAWRAAGPAELHLCLAGLQQLLDAVSHEHNPACQPAPIYRSALALDAAAAEYSAAHDGNQQVLPMVHLLDLSGSSRHSDAQRALEAAMRACVLRAMHWALWLLGCWG